MVQIVHHMLGNVRNKHTLLKLGLYALRLMHIRFKLSVNVHV